MYPNLKLQIFRRGIHQNYLARSIGMSEVTLSRTINGYRTPTESERALLAHALEADESWLFERLDSSLSKNEAEVSNHTRNGDSNDEVGQEVNI